MAGSQEKRIFSEQAEKAIKAEDLPEVVNGVHGLLYDTLYEIKEYEDAAKSFD
jgi:hypothetical protein